MQDYLFRIGIRLIVMFTALPFHEVAHGWIAYKMGDPTAKNMGRLDLNPFKHFDPIGSVMLLLTGFGFAKPVPVNPYYFKNPKKGMAVTALAGPVSNVLLATVLLLIEKLLLYFVPMSMAVGTTISTVFSIMIITNLQLAVFNLLPVPPLDGSKVLGYFLSDRVNYMMMQYQQYLMIGLFALLWTDVLNYPLSRLANLLYDGIFYLTYFVDWIAALL